MSFSFTAAGGKHQVVAQLRAIGNGQRNIGTGQLGPELAHLLAGHINADQDNADGDDHVYVVTASGHSGGGSPASLRCEVTAHWVIPEAVAIIEPDSAIT